MLNNTEDTILGVLGIQREQMVYNLYNTEEAMINIEAEIDENKIYSGNTAVIDLQTEYTPVQSVTTALRQQLPFQ